MANYDASDLDCDYVQCAVCEKAIKGANWFARIRHGEWVIALCCPLCTEAFEKAPRAYIRRIETLDFMARSHADSALND